MCFFVRRLLGMSPRNAHGRRTVDGSYFSIWVCAHGHARVGRPECSPSTCVGCALGWAMKNGGPSPSPNPWRLASKTEARSFIYNAAGADAFRGVGFEVLR